MTTERDCKNNRKPFGDWVYGRYRKVHVAMRILPRLESDFAVLIQKMSCAENSGKNATLEYHYMVQSLAAIRSQIRSAFKALSDIRKGIERSGISDQEFEKGIRQLHNGHPEGNQLLAKLQNTGGLRASLKKISLSLLDRHESYSRCLRLAKEFDHKKRDKLGEVAIAIWDEIPGSPGTPDVVYTFLCAAGPWGWAVTAYLVAAVILMDDDSGRDDDDPPDEDEEPDDVDDDPDGGVCYPEPGIDPIEGTCTPI